MKNFRRSKKGEKSSDAKQHSISIPNKDAIAIVPPKKVIKALYDYQVQNPAQNRGYLSFAQGDFLHVVGREDDSHWYEACNPLHGTTGLVPVNYFELVGKQVRSSVGYEPLGVPGQAATGHDSGYAEKTQDSVNGTGDINGAKVVARSSMQRSGAMVYGVVMYDFKAERPDELDAHAGEAIIVIAQSNPEWFVAKPIQRLGGPGLIPVSFIEIRDMTTGQAVPDTAGAVARAGVPKVEEWKKMAADYKNSSIPLGRLDMGGASKQNLQQGMERMSLGNSSRQSQDPRASQRNGSSSAIPTTSNTQSAHFQQQQYRASRLLAPVRARVPRYTPLHKNEWWFEVEVTMADNRSWLLYRTYKDFYSLQLNLIEQFPEAAGKVEKIKRTLPYMPGPLAEVTEQLTDRRRGCLDEYLSKLLVINAPITNSPPVKLFFEPRVEDGDQEMDAHNFASGDRFSGISQQSTIHDDSRQSSHTNLTATSSGPYGSPQRAQPQQQFRSSSPYNSQSYNRHYRDGSELSVSQPPQMLRNNSSMTQQSATSATSLQSSTYQTAAAGLVKVKVWFGEASCVVIRLPPTYNYTSLVAKIRERYAVEPGVDKAAAATTNFIIEYKDEPTGEYYGLDGDEDLEQAKSRCDKLTLRAEAEASSMM